MSQPSLIDSSASQRARHLCRYLYRVLDSHQGWTCLHQQLPQNWWTHWVTRWVTGTGGAHVLRNPQSSSRVNIISKVANGCYAQFIRGSIMNTLPPSLCILLVTGSWIKVDVGIMLLFLIDRMTDSRSSSFFVATSKALNLWEKTQFSVWSR